MTRGVNYPGQPLAPLMVRFLAAYAETGDKRAAAERLGVTRMYFKTVVADAYLRLDVHTAIDAFRAMGWLVTP